MSEKNPETILLVEDNRADINLLKESLRLLKIDINLFVISNGSQAMEFIQGRGIYKDIKKPDLVILDINLPGKNGFEILKEIRSNNCYPDTPIVILTSSQREEDISLGKELKANEIISKPSDFFEFNSLVESVINKYMKAKMKY